MSDPVDIEALRNFIRQNVSEPKGAGHYELHLNTDEVLDFWDLLNRLEVQSNKPK